LETLVVLTTFNSRYIHASFGLRYLYANLAELKPRTRLLEFTLQQNPMEVAEKIVALNPRIVGIGVYIWNAVQSRELVSILKRIAPEIKIVLGGPEVSYETEIQTICQQADYVIQGESDFLFRELCQKILAGEQAPLKIIKGPLPDLNQLVLPYSEYTDEDLKHRVLYVEASRGCPYKCEYCLSSLDEKVRNFELSRFLKEMDALITRGARQFKFVDRTFNLSPAISTGILQFFLERMHLGLFLHFEMVPDRLPDGLKALIEKFPFGSLQFEIGVQTWSVETAARVSRRQNYTKIEENFKYLRSQTGVHLHADLIAGLPGEPLESFAKGFDALARLVPHEIQVGILKRLRGTPIVRHDAEWAMVYDENPPYRVLRTKVMSFEELQSIARFSKYLDLIANSGNFKNAFKLISEWAWKQHSRQSFFWGFYELTEFMAVRHAQSFGIALPALVESVFRFLVDRAGIAAVEASEALLQDYAFGAVRRDPPKFLLEASGGSLVSGLVTSQSVSVLPARQARHLN